MIVMLCVFQISLFGQTDSVTVDKKYVKELLQIGSAFLNNDSADNPVKISRARLVNSRATKNSRRQVKKIAEDYEKGLITFSSYIHLMSAELGISVKEYLEYQSLIVAHSLSRNKD